MIQHRSRMHRTRTGKSLALTPRDLEIFRTLFRYRFLRSTYLHAFVGGESEKRFKERLGDLFHEGYIDRPAEQWRFADSRCLPVVHELGKGGREVLAATGATEPEAITWLRNGPHRQFEHSLMTCEVLASIELEVRRHSDLRMIAWPEILAKAPENTRQSVKPYQLSTGDGLASVVPDAIFGIEYRRDGRKAYRFFAFEADRGTMPITRRPAVGTSVLGKLEAYRAVLGAETYRRSLNIPNLLVLTMTISDARSAEMVDRCLALPGDRRQFLFRPFAGMTAPDLSALSEPWLRPGMPPLHISVGNSNE